MISLKDILEFYKLSLQSDKDLKIDGDFKLDDKIGREKFKKIQSMLKPSKIISMEKPVVSVGDVYEKPTDTLPLTVAVLDITEDSVFVALMSHVIELATPDDLLVSFNHPLRNKWIVETDLAIELSKDKFFSNFYFVGKLEKKDIEILKNFINGEDLPKDKTGRGFAVPEKQEFKKIEFARYNMLFLILMKKLDELETYERDDEEVIVSLTDIIAFPLKEKNLKKSLQQLYEREGVEIPSAAATQIKPLEDKEVKIIFDDKTNELHLLFNKETVGKSVELVIAVKNREFPLFRIEKAPYMMTVNLQKEDFSMVYPFLKVKIKDER